MRLDLYKLFTVLVRDQNQAVEVLAGDSSRRSPLQLVLCPGNTHRDVAQIVEAVGDGVSVSVARGDGPSMRIVAQAKASSGMVLGSAARREELAKAPRKSNAFSELNDPEDQRERFLQ